MGFIPPWRESATFLAHIDRKVILMNLEMDLEIYGNIVQGRRDVYALCLIVFEGTIGYASCGSFRYLITRN